MLVHAIVHYIGLPEDLAVALVLGFIVLAVLCLGFYAAFRLDDADKEKKRSRKVATRSTGPGLQGVPPADQYVIPARLPECGDKNCELMGCAILGECQRLTLYHLK